MDICIVKSASKDVYLKQNLEILRLPQGDSVELRYRTVWVDEDVTDYLHTDSHHSATIVFCDPPEFKLTPIRRFDLYGAHFDDDDESGAITLSGRCGAFVHPQGSAEWAQRLKLKHPGAGDPPGKFVVAFDGCPLAGDTVQQAAWQAVIDNLVQQPKYDECLFFYNNGLTTSDGNSTGPRDLEVGEKYSLTIASYNKHLGGDVLRSTGLEVVADDSVIEAELAEPKPLPASASIEIMLRPKAAGKTRIILWTGRPGPDERAMSLDVECRGEGPDDGKWKCYQIVRERARDNHQLHAEILRKCFDCSAAKAASELALVLYNGGDYGKCAGLLTELTKETRYVMSEEALEKIVLAHCRDKKKFPVPCYLDYYTSAERWRTLVDTVKGMGVDDAARVVLSMVSEYDQLKGGVEERDLAELLVTVASGFKRGEDIIKVAKWLLDAGVQGSDLEMAQTMARFCYEFLRDRLGEETLHIDKSQLLEQCVKAGHDCEGPGLATFVYAWVYRLLESGKPEDALDAVEQYSKYLLTDDLAYSLYDIANKLETSRSFHRVRLGRIYLMAARNGRLNGHLTFAKSSLSNAEGIRSRLTDEDFAREVQQEREEIERAAKELDADDEFQCTIERIRTTYRGKRIAVVGGATERALIRDLEQALGSGIEVEWYRSSLATHVNGSTSLEKGVRSGKTCLVVQLEQSGHSNVNGIKDKDAKVIFCQGCHWKTVIRRIGRELSCNGNEGSNQV